MKRKIKIVSIVLILFIIIIISFKSNNNPLKSKDNILIFNIWSKISDLVKGNNSEIEQIEVAGNNDQLIEYMPTYNSNNTKEKTVDFKVVNGSIEIENVNLNETIIQNKEVIQEKIAPGTKGKFNINLENLNEEVKMRYNIGFKSKNKKPQNLAFQIEGEETEYNTLEELQQQLNGILEEGEKKEIRILWEWRYESGNEKQDLQDTKDSKNIRNYKFEVEAKLNEI